MIRQDYRATGSGEALLLTFNFQKYMGAGVTIGSASAVAAVETGTDATPATLLSGVPSISGPVVSQAVLPIITGNVYKVEVTANTSDGQILMDDMLVAVAEEVGS